MRSMSTGARLPKSTEPSVAEASPTRIPSISTSVWPEVGAAQMDLRRRTDAARLVDVEAGDAAQHVGDAFGSELFDFGGADDGHRGAGLADRLFDAVGGDDDFRQLVGMSGSKRRNAAKGGENAGGPRGGPRSGFEHGSSSRPTDGGLGCTVKGRSPGSRFVAPLLLPRTVGPQWMTWRAARRLQLRGQPRHWPARLGEPHRIPVWPGSRRTANDRRKAVRTFPGGRKTRAPCTEHRRSARDAVIRRVQYDVDGPPELRHRSSIAAAGRSANPTFARRNRVKIAAAAPENCIAAIIAR